MTNQHFRYSNRRGVVIFVVLGAIVVLGALVMSYNYFVRGKFNESREILMHQRALKCAQSTASFVASHLLSDLQTTTDSSSPGFILRNEVFCYNDPDKLSEALKEKWFDRIACSGFVNSILSGTIGKEPFTYDVEFRFTNVVSLNSLKEQKGVDANIAFFDCEKIGKLTIRVTITIGKTREIWQETRPFKMVFPFPMPITKFSLYWNEGVSSVDPYKFNTSQIDFDTGKPTNGVSPFVFDNDSFDGGENNTANLWYNRGWIYVGGSDLCLNRAVGDKNFGQRFYSYPRPGNPATLHLNFPTGDNWEGKLYKNEKLGFRIAQWGFSAGVLESSANNMWAKILKGEFKENPPESNKKYWNSSSLHLFSDVNARLNNSDDVVPSVTRVVGKVYDRFMELSYLLPVNSSNAIFAAIINYPDAEAYTEASRESNEGDASNLVAGYTFDDYLYFVKDNPYENMSLEDAQVLESYFGSLVFEDPANQYAISYRNVMSKIVMRPIDESYDVIAQYSANSNQINLPPQNYVPKATVTKFGYEGFATLENFSRLPDVVRNIEIPDIGKVEDKSLGLELRKCYELKGTSEEIRNALRFEFGSSSSGYGLDLNNLVYKLTPNEEYVNLESNLSMKSAGTVFSEGTVRVGSFAKSQGAEEAPLLILAESGNILLDNSENEIQAYLVALGEGGTIKANNADSPLLVRGGIAVSELEPDNLPKAGGYMVYNLAFDPVGDNFLKYFGIAIGPVGGEL